MLTNLMNGWPTTIVMLSPMLAPQQKMRRLAVIQIVLRIT
jgi:hypothetical protein